MFKHRFHVHSFAALGLLVLLAACSKDKAAPAPANSWQVDGQAQQAAKVTVEVGTPAMNTGMLAINIWQDISNASSTGSAVAVYLFVPNRVGTYSLTSATTSASAGYSDYASPGKGSNLYEATSGSVTITALTSNSVAGTFTFTAAEVFTPQHTKQITNGQLNATF